MILSKQRTNDFLHDYAMYFDLVAQDGEQGIELREGVSTEMLWEKFRGYLSLDVMKAFMSQQAVKALGVYHLGTLVTGTLREADTKCEELKNIDRWYELFELACLLHDVGHAPFSHTGEVFYLNNGERTKLHSMIVGLTGDESLKHEIEENSKEHKAAAHELISVIVSLKAFPKLFSDSEERSFFARCICGDCYSVPDNNKKFSFLNCLLNLNIRQISMIRCRKRVLLLLKVP